MLFIFEDYIMAAPLMIASALFSAVGQIQQGRQADAAGKSEQNMQEFNAKMSEVRARQVNAAAGRQEDEQRRNMRSTIGLQLASSAEAGAGLNGDLLRQSIFDGESDTQAIRYEGALKSQGLAADAAMARAAGKMAREKGKQARNASYLNAATTLASAGKTYFSGK